MAPTPSVQPIVRRSRTSKAATLRSMHKMLADVRATIKQTIPVIDASHEAIAAADDLLANRPRVRMRRTLP